jgi:hypothetical protein
MRVAPQVVFPYHLFEAGMEEFDINDDTFVVLRERD